MSFLDKSSIDELSNKKSLPILNSSGQIEQISQFIKLLSTPVIVLDKNCVIKCANASASDLMSGQKKSNDSLVNSSFAAFCKSEVFEKITRSLTRDHFFEVSWKEDTELARMRDEPVSVVMDINLAITSQERIAVIQIHDVTERNFLRQRATTDELTGLHNRRYFFEEGEREFARVKRSFAPHAMLLIDIDHFKSINDKYGHTSGDEALRCISTIFKQCARKADIAARVGGEEFAIILLGASRHGSELISKSLLDNVRSSEVQTRTGAFRLTFSIGICVLRREIGSFLEWYDAADKQLYNAKSSGRNCYSYEGIINKG